MRIEINLATQPYEDAWRFFRFWGLALGGLLVFTALLVHGALTAWRTQRMDSRTLAAEQQTLRRYETQEAAGMAILNRPENHDVRVKSLMINGLIRRKEFSWTLIFASLERIMPSKLHVVSITPQIDKSDQILVHMTVAGDSRDKAVELVQNMEKSGTFRRAEVLSETNAGVTQKAGTPDTTQFEIQALYVPGAEQGSGE